MAFGYKVPNFNLWARVWYIKSSGLDISDRYYLGPFYTRCSIAKDINLFAMHFNFPKGSYLRSQNMTPFNNGDIIQVAGWEYMFGWIESVYDVGAGFPNEHRMARVYFPQDITPDSFYAYYVPSCLPTLEPPEGAEFINSIPPSDYWQVPTEVEIHPPP